MDPITATTTLITLASFMKELVEVGQSIARSIEKVSENRRQIRNLTNEILRTLSDLANLTRGREEQLQTPALLAALGNLKAQMLHVLDVCRHISPVERKPGLRGLKSQVKGWMKRDEIEAEIRRLKEHTNKCFMMFMTFSTARVEQTAARIAHTTERTQDVSITGVNATLRVEQRLIVNTVENQVKLRKLETMMAQVLLETSFGQSVMERTIQVIASDSDHRTVETQYLSAQTLRLIPLLQQSVSGGASVLDPSLWASNLSLVRMDEVTTENILHSILGAILQVNCSAMDMELMNGCIIHMGTRLRFLGMTSESVAWELFACQSLRRLANDENHSVVMPRLARALRRLSVAYRVQLQYQEALRASEQSVEVWRYIFEGTSNFDNHVPFLRALAVHMDNLKHANQPESVLPLAEESVGIARADLRHTFEYYEKDDDWWEEDEFAGRKCCVAIFRYAQALAFARRPSDACSIATEGFEVLQALPKNAVARIQVGPYIDLLLDQMCIVSEGGGFTLEWLTGTVFLIRSLAQRYPQDFSAQFLSLLHAYTYLCAQDLDHEFSPQNLRAFLEPSSNTLTPSLPPFYHPLYQHLAGVVEDAISAFYQRPSEAAFDLVHNLFLAHSQSATAAFRQVVERISSADNRDLQILDWVVHTLVQLLNGPIGKAERPELVALLQRLWTLHGLQLVTFCHHCRVGSCRALWQEGLYTDTMNILTICLNASFHLDEGPLTRISRDALIIKAAVLWDMGRTADAIVVLTEIEPHVSFPQRTLLPLDNTGNTSGDGWFLLYCWMRIQLLRRATRSRELLDFVEQILSDPAGRIGTDAQSHLYCVLIRLERLELKQEMGGEVEETLSGVERIVEMCRGNAFSDDDREFRLCGLIYALVALGKCLAGVGRNDEALVACREAVSIYRENESEMWESFLVTTRKHEIGLMAYRALSIQLAATLGDVNDEAPVYAEEAVKMYRDLVALVPRHRPALAEALQSLARISQRDDGVALPACKEAVEILRDVAATEDYLLPMLVDALDQLQGYLSGHEDHDSEASVVRKEAADARRKMQMQFASTPTGELFRLPIHLSRLMRDESPSESSDDSEQTLVGGENGMDDAIEVDSDTTLVCNSDPPSPKLLDENENISVPDHEKHLSSLKETLYTPMEIRLRVAPIDMLLVVLGGLVVVLGVCVAVLLRRDGTRGGIHV